MLGDEFFNMVHACPGSFRFTGISGTSGAEFPGVSRTCDQYWLCRSRKEYGWLKKPIVRAGNVDFNHRAFASRYALP